MLSYEESLKILRETNALIDGHFILSSGLHSPQYVQCAQLMSKPEKASKLCFSLAEKIKSEFNNIDLIANARTGIGKSLLCLFGAAAGAYFGFFVGRSKDDEQM